MRQDQDSRDLLEGEGFRVVGETQASGDSLEDENREALAHPVFRHNTVTAVIEVTSARPSGLLGRAVALLDPLLDLRDKVTDLAQEKIEEKLLDKRFRLPEEFRDFNVTINSSKFIGMDGGLGVEVSASGSITQDQLATLINESVD